MSRHHITVHLRDGRSGYALEGARLDDVFRTPGLTTADVYAYEKGSRCKVLEGNARASMKPSRASVLPRSALADRARI